MAKYTVKDASGVSVIENLGEYEAESPRMAAQEALRENTIKGNSLLVKTNSETVWFDIETASGITFVVRNDSFQLPDLEPHKQFSNEKPSKIDRGGGEKGFIESVKEIIKELI